MKDVALHSGPELRNALRELPADTIHHLSWGAEPHVHGGFRREADLDEVSLDGVHPGRIDGSIFRKSEPVTAHVVLGTEMFDHTNGAPPAPDWRETPYGDPKYVDQRPRPAAIVHGNATVTASEFAARLYSGDPGQTMVAFRAMLLQHLGGSQ